MKVMRKITRRSKKTDQKPSGIARKGRKPRSIGARKSHPVARIVSKRAAQESKSLKPLAKRTERTIQTTAIARKAGKAVGKFLGSAIGNAERIIHKTAETAKGILG